MKHIWIIKLWSDLNIFKMTDMLMILLYEVNLIDTIGIIFSIQFFFIFYYY
jgi:hypothetical protein